MSDLCPFLRLALAPAHHTIATFQPIQQGSSGAKRVTARTSGHEFARLDGALKRAEREVGTRVRFQLLAPGSVIAWSDSLPPTPGRRMGMWPLINQVQTFAPEPPLWDSAPVRTGAHWLPGATRGETIATGSVERWGIEDPQYETSKRLG